MLFFLMDGMRLMLFQQEEQTELQEERGEEKLKLSENKYMCFSNFTIIVFIHCCL